MYICHTIIVHTIYWIYRIQYISVIYTYTHIISYYIHQPVWNDYCSTSPPKITPSETTHPKKALLSLQSFRSLRTAERVWWLPNLGPTSPPFFRGALKPWTVGSHTFLPPKKSYVLYIPSFTPPKKTARAFVLGTNVTNTGYNIYSLTSGVSGVNVSV